MLGNIVYKKQIELTGSITKTDIDLTSLTPGIYFVRITTEEKSAEIKIILTK